MVCVLQTVGYKGNLVLQLAVWGPLESFKNHLVRSYVAWNAELELQNYVAHNFITLNNILASLLHINRTCFVASKIKEWDTFLIYGACFVVHQECKSKILDTHLYHIFRLIIA